MTRPSPFRVRFALVAILAVLALGFALPGAYSQPGRPPIGPPGRPGGFGPPSIPGRPAMPRPPAMPGGVTGMPGRPPGGVAGVPGGITGIPATPAVPGGVTGMPGGGITGTPGGIGGMPNRPPLPGRLGGGLVGGGLGGSRTETVWTCTGCNGELGRGPNDPGQTICPHCGARLEGIVTRPGVGGAPTTGTPQIPNNPLAGGGGTTTPAPTPTPPPSDSGSSDSSSSGGTGRVLKVIGLVIAAVFLAGVLTMLALVVKNSSGAAPKRHHRPRREYDDE